MANHHAPWRIDPKFCNGDISPRIHDTSTLLPLYSLRHAIRFVLSTCDLEFLKKNLKNLIVYQESASAIYLVVGVYSAVDSESNLKSSLQEIKQQYSLNKIIFLVFTSPKLNAVLSQKNDPESIWDYKINFIRNARYNLLLDIWKFLKLDSVELTLINSSAYVIDFDNFFLDDLNHILKLQYGEKKLIFSWNSLQSPNKNFPATLSGFSHEGGFNHSYKIIKAGFTAFSPNSLSRQFLQLYKFYTIGDPVSSIYLRLFTFYFSDQVGILLALLELRVIQPEHYSSEIAWIDIATSDIINLKQDKAKYMYYPKGKTLKP